MVEESKGKRATELRFKVDEGGRRTLALMHPVKATPHRNNVVWSLEVCHSMEILAVPESASNHPTARHRHLLSLNTDILTREVMAVTSDWDITCHSDPGIGEGERPDPELAVLGLGNEPGGV